MPASHRPDPSSPRSLLLSPSAVSRRGPLAATLGATALGLVLGLAAPPAAAQGDGPGAQNGRRFAEARILVQARAGLAEARFRKVLEGRKGRLMRRIGRTHVTVVEVPAGQEEAIARALSLDPNIKFAEVDLAVKPDVIPNDQYYGNAWHLPKIQAPTAWDTSKGDGITVAVLDTGVDAAHPDLAANLVPGRNVVSGTADTSDINGHGTWVSGVVAALSNNALGVSSVAWNAKVMPVRVSNNADGTAWTSDIANGLIWAADNGAKVANISYGVSGSSTVKNAAQYFQSKGGTVCVSAGNSSSDLGYPSNPYVLSISATNSSDVKTSWSSFGPYVDFAAPGESILSTSRGGSYSYVSGTSFSSPMTAGVVALMMAANSTLKPTDLEAILQNTADDLGSAGWDSYYGFGRINAARAVAMAANSQPSDTQAPTVSVKSPAAGSTVKDGVAIDVSAQDNYRVARVELYVNGSLVTTDYVSPYQFIWDSSASAGKSVTLSARAYDEAGNVGTSSNVSVNVAAPADTQPPTVAITSPTAGATVTGTVTMKASATDNVKVNSVSLYLDGKLRCSSTSSVSCSWNTRYATRGSHTISATAKDSAGNTATTSVSVTKR